MARSASTQTKDGQSRKQAKKLPVSAAPTVITASSDAGPQSSVELLKSFDTQGRRIQDIAWSPDGLFLATTDFDGTIKVWDVSDGRCIRTLTHDDAPLRSIAWGPDITRLASIDERGEIFLWDPVFGTLLRKLAPQDDALFPDRWAGAELIWLSQTKFVLCRSWRDKRIWCWDTENGKVVSKVRTFGHPVDMALSARGDRLIVATNDGATHFFGVKAEYGTVRFEATGGMFGEPITGPLAIDRTGGVLAHGMKSGTILLWYPRRRKSHDSLEGHSAPLVRLAFSHDSDLLLSTDAHGVTQLWSTRELSPLHTVTAGVGAASISAFDRSSDRFVTTDGSGTWIHVWRIDRPRLLRSTPTKKTVRHTSAKVVLVGQTEVGKSCLAMRLAENRYPKDDEQGTTHGMRFWSMEGSKLHTSAKAPRGHRRTVVLWDFGGQDEYRLVHQLFLHDTTLALVLIDPTRARAAFDDARDWNKRLDKQLRGRKAVKFLIGAKQDRPSHLVDKAAIKALCKECGFKSYLEVSAKADRGIKELRKAIAGALNWDKLGKASRPELRERIHDEIERRRDKGDTVLLLEELSELLRRDTTSGFDPNAVKSVSDDLSLQGVVVQTKLTDGDEILVLQLPVIERYAGSLIVAAKQNPRGVPALEERTLGSRDFPLPGLKRKDRIPKLQERVVLECVAELLIQHGICYRHQGLLIFPTLFPEGPEGKSEELKHSVSLFYDFTGAIDNIYASLVAKLMVSEEFGQGRLWPSRVEFDRPGEGVCGIHHIKYQGGLGHIDLFFAEGAGTDRKRLFTRFVEEHLREQGIEVREHQAIKCRGCTREIAEDVVHTNIAGGLPDVVCQYCRTVTLISEGVGRIKESDPQSDQKIFALRKKIEERTAEDVEKAKRAAAGVTAAPSTGPIRILHLSDLHFTQDTSPDAKLQWLLQDLRNGEGLGCGEIEYLVVSGDMGDKGNAAGMEKAREFVSLLGNELRLSAQRCIFVPGNHDVHETEQSFDWFQNADKAKTVEPDEKRWHYEGSVIFIPNKDRYRLRFKQFSDIFYHKIMSQPYPDGYAEQGQAYLFPATGIQFLAFNSAWQIDQFNRKRAGIHPDAAARAIAEADRQVKDAVERGEMPKGQKPLRLAVWHHPVQHPESMRDIDFIGHLQGAGVKVALHGDVHEINRETMRNWHPKKIQIAGVGSFGSKAVGRPESTPRHYSLLEISRDLTSIRVHTRKQNTDHGAWSGWNEWPREDGQSGTLPYYDIKLA